MKTSLQRIIIIILLEAPALGQDYHGRPNTKQAVINKLRDCDNQNTVTGQKVKIIRIECSILINIELSTQGVPTRVCVV